MKIWAPKKGEESGGLGERSSRRRGVEESNQFFVSWHQRWRRGVSWLLDGGKWGQPDRFDRVSRR